MNYTDNVRLCRVDFFKESGKWYTTEAVEFIEDVDSIHKVFAKSLKVHLKGRLSGMIAVCLEPYHRFSCPIMIKVDNIDDYLGE